MATQERDPRAYELVTVFIPEISEEDTQAQVEKVSAYISNAGGDVSRTLTDSPWGRRRLAYTIRYNGTDYRDGYYTVFHFDSRPSTLGELERDLKLDINVMRYLLVHDDPKAGEKHTNAEGEALEGEETADIASAEQVDAPTPSGAVVAETDTAQDSSVAVAETTEAVASDTGGSSEPPAAGDDPVASDSPTTAVASDPAIVVDDAQEDIDPTHTGGEPVEGANSAENPETAASETGEDASDKE